jgi:predicted RNase H-like HicB family nuclease
MRFPIAIELGDEHHAYGVTFPDVEGCFSAGDTYDEAIDNALEALQGHLEVAVEFGDPIPRAGTVEQHKDNPIFKGYSWAFVEVDMTPYLGQSKKINVTLPEYLIHRIDSVSSNRSKFLADAALKALS